jgi:Fur family peroxide stress response transcriptional regulator
MRIIPSSDGGTDSSGLPGRGFRSTRARRLILECVRSTERHPTAEWVFRKVRRQLPRVSLGTVYRNLRLLVQAGLLVERAGPGGSRFDGNVSEHHHFTCVRCRRVFDLMEPVDHSLDLQIASGTGFEVLGHRIEFFGWCQHCSASPQGRSAWPERV